MKIYSLKQESWWIQKTNLNRNNTSTGQYTLFQSLVPLRYKWNRIKTLSYRICIICSTDIVEGKLNTLRNIRRENSYPRKFIIKYMITKVRTNEIRTVNKKFQIMGLQFRGDEANKILIHRLRKTIRKSFNAEELWLLFSRSSMVTTRLKDELARATT